MLEFLNKLVDAGIITPQNIAILAVIGLLAWAVYAILQIKKNRKETSNLRNKEAEQNVLRIQRLEDKVETETKYIKERINKIDERYDQVDKKLDKVCEDSIRTNENVRMMNTTLVSHDKKFDRIDAKLDRLLEK